jgi:hypothetical protein
MRSIADDGKSRVFLFSLRQNVKMTDRNRPLVPS